MNTPIQPESPSNLDRWLGKSWLGYGLICFCSMFLCFALSGVSQAIGLGSGKLLDALAPLALLASLLCFAGALVCRIAIRMLDRDLEITPRTKYSRIAGAIFAASLLLGALSAVFNAAMGAAQPNEMAAPMQTYDLLGGDLFVTVPSSLSVDPNVGHSENTVGLINQVEGISVVVTARSTSDIVQKNLEKFGKAEAARSMQHLRNAKLIESGLREVDGTIVIRNRIRHEIDGLFADLLVEHQQLGDYWCEIRCAAAPSKFQEFQDQFDLMSQSIRQSYRPQ